MIFLNTENNFKNKWQSLVDYSNKKLNKKQIKDLKKKRDSDIVWMNDRWVIKKYNLIYIKQIKAAGWNFNGIILSLVNLQNIKKASTMIGIVIAGINLIKENKEIHAWKN